jgi:hypothetical protein
VQASTQVLGKTVGTPVIVEAASAGTQAAIACVAPLPVSLTLRPRLCDHRVSTSCLLKGLQPTVFQLGSATFCRQCAGCVDLVSLECHAVPVGVGYSQQFTGV